MRAAAHHGDAVAHAERLRQVAGDHQHGETLLREPADDLVNLGLRADIHALRRLVEDEQLRLRREPAGERDFLLIAAAQATPPGASGPEALIAEIADEIARAAPLRAEAQPARRERAADGSPW